MTPSRKRKDTPLERAAMRWYRYWNRVATDTFIAGGAFDKLHKACARHAKKGAKK